MWLNSTGSVANSVNPVPSDDANRYADLYNEKNGCQKTLYNVAYLRLAQIQMAVLTRKRTLANSVDPDQTPQNGV